MTASHRSRGRDRQKRIRDRRQKGSKPKLMHRTKCLHQRGSTTGPGGGLRRTTQKSFAKRGCLRNCTHGGWRGPSSDRRFDTLRRFRRSRAARRSRGCWDTCCGVDGTQCVLTRCHAHIELRKLSSKNLHTLDHGDGAGGRRKGCVGWILTTFEPAQRTKGDRSTCGSSDPSISDRSAEDNTCAKSTPTEQSRSFPAHGGRAPGRFAYGGGGSRKRFKPAPEAVYGHTQDL